MGACREMRLPRSESESQSMSPSAALDSLAAAAAPRQRRPPAGLVDLDRGPVFRRLRPYPARGRRPPRAADRFILIVELRDRRATRPRRGARRPRVRMRREAYAGKIFGEEA